MTHYVKQSYKIVIMFFTHIFRRLASALFS